MKTVEQRDIHRVIPANVRDQVNIALAISGLKRGSLVDVKNESALKRLPIAYTIADYTIELKFDNYVGYIHGRHAGVSRDADTAKKIIDMIGFSGYERHLILGQLLGYPNDAIRAYARANAAPHIETQTKQKLETFNDKLLVATSQGRWIPSFIAYIMDQPAYFDITNGIITESSVQLGHIYQDYIRRVHPWLASRFEKKFYSMLEKEARKLKT